MAAVCREAEGTEPAVPDVGGAGLDASMAEAVAAFQRELIETALARARGNWAEAARLLKLDRGNLHRLAKRLGVK